MNKKNNKYKITLEETVLKDDSQQPKTLSFEFENHDDLFNVIHMAKSKQLFSQEQDAVELALGLKLFSEVMLRYRSHPIFEELKPAFGNFMKQLKST